MSSNRGGLQRRWRQTGAARRGSGQRPCQSGSGDTPPGWDVDDYILATNHAVNVVALAYGMLGEQYKKEIEILEARTLALKLMGSTDDAALSPCLFQIYMENRINFLKK